MAMSDKSKRNLLMLVTRWFGRASSVASVIVILLFLVGFDPREVRPKEWIGLAFFPAGIVVGLIAAWWKEGLGACITLLSLAAFYGVYGWLMGSNVNSAAFLVFASPAILFLISWMLSRRNLSEVNT